MKPSYDDLLEILIGLTNKFPESEIDMARPCISNTNANIILSWHKKARAAIAQATKERQV